MKRFPFYQRRKSSHRRCRGSMMMEMIVAIGILTTATVPIAWSFMGETQLCRHYYFRAVAMEIVDGEMEILVAGEGVHQPEGTHPYTVTAAAAENLPPGEFRLTRQDRQLRLEWVPRDSRKANSFAREARLP